jgi:hypothetical protein
VHLGLGDKLVSMLRRPLGEMSDPRMQYFFQAMGQRAAWRAWEYKKAGALAFEEAPGDGCVR